MALLLVLSGCGGGSDPAPVLSSRALPTAPAGLPVVDVRVGAVTLRAEVADTEPVREAGLRGRTGVPPGTGMVFRFDGPARQRFTMAGVSYPLVAVFVRSGTVVAVAQMAPCAGSVDECPLYGPAEDVDTVVEAAPESLPDVRPGDAVW